MTRTRNQTPTTITRDIYDLAYARLTHPVHADPDDRCPLCIAVELNNRATARLDDLTNGDPFADTDGGRLRGAMTRAAMGRLDLADGLVTGDITLVLVERSGAFGLSIRYRVNR